MIAALVSNLPALVLLTTVSWLLHGQGMLDRFWRFDDGYHLDFAARFSPADYLLNPEVAVAFSNANLTPWASLWYDLNLSLFGFSPGFFYVTQWAMLTLSAWLFHCLLASRLPFAAALLASVSLLLGVTSVWAAQALMIGHYVVGMVWALLCLLAFRKAIATHQRRWLWLAVFAYVNAALCKELFVPLPALLLAWPGLPWPRRLRLVFPFAVAGALYLAWRIHVLGGLVGGYALLPGSGREAALAYLQSAPGQLLGQSGWATLAWLLWLAMVVWWFARCLSVSERVFVLTAATMLGLPVAVAAANGSLHLIGTRVFYAVWPGVLAAGAWALTAGWQRMPRMRMRALLCLAAVLWMVLAALRLPDYRETQFESGVLRFESLYRDYLAANPAQVIWINDASREYFAAVLSGAWTARHALAGEPPAAQQAPLVLDQRPEVLLATLLATPALNLWALCNGDARFADLMARARSALQAGQAVDVMVEREGRRFSWAFGGEIQSVQLVLSTPRGTSVVQVGPTGQSSGSVTSLQFVLRTTDAIRVLPPIAVGDRNPLQTVTSLALPDLSCAPGVASQEARP